MKSMAPWKTWLQTPPRWLTVTLVCVVGAWVIWRYGLVIASGGSKWQTADWLISYEAGFVRRGLVGALIFSLQRHWGLPVLPVTFLVQAVAYVAALACVARLYLLRERPVFWWLILFSPAFLLMFPLLDQPGGLRKELLLYIAYGVLLWGLRQGRARNGLMVCAAVVYGVALLSHEVSALAAPFLLHALYQHGATPRPVRLAWMALFGLMAFLGLVLAVSFHGEQTTPAMCQAVLQAGLRAELCRGTLTWFSMSTAQAMSMLSPYWGVYSKLYPPLLMVSLAPLLGTDWVRRKWVFLILAFLPLCPLYVVALDWGRWIHIYVTMVFMTLLHDDELRPVKSVRIPVWLVMAYVLSWGIPHCCAVRPFKGVLSLLGVE